MLVSAGVGVTPLLSMLHELVGRCDSRPVLFVHGARDGRHHPLAREVRDLVGRAPDARTHVAYSRPHTKDEAGRDYDGEGRVDAALIEGLLPGLDGDFYVCGPAAFMAEIQQGLESRGVPAQRIRSETF